MRTLLYAGNIPDSATAADLEQLLRPDGTIGAAQIIADPRTGRSPGTDDFYERITAKYHKLRQLTPRIKLDIHT